MEPKDAEEIAGIANCGCWYHAEEGIPCPHDIALMKKRTVQKKNKKGLSLIELMVVVAIVGILSAVVIPQFVRMGLKSKSAEATENIVSIQAHEESYLAEFGTYRPVLVTPSGNPSHKKRVWKYDSEEQYLGWNKIAFKPRTDSVYFSYQVLVSRDGGSYLIIAEGDLDNDGERQWRAYLGGKLDTPYVLMKEFGRASGCPIQPRTVAPCDERDGTFIF